MSSISSPLPVHPSSCPSPICFYIFIAWYPFFLTQDPIYICRIPRWIQWKTFTSVSNVLSFPLRAASQRYMTNSSGAKYRDTQDSIWFHCMCQSQAIASHILRPSRMQLYPLSFVCHGDAPFSKRPREVSTTGTKENRSKQREESHIRKMSSTKMSTRKHSTVEKHAANSEEDKRTLVLSKTCKRYFYCVTHWVYEIWWVFVVKRSVEWSLIIHESQTVATSVLEGLPSGPANQLSPNFLFQRCSPDK